MQKIGAHVAHFKPRRVKPIYKTHGVAGFDVDKLFNVALIEAPSTPFSVNSRLAHSIILSMDARLSYARSFLFYF